MRYNIYQILEIYIIYKLYIIYCIQYICNSPGLAQGVLDTRCFHSTTFLYLFYKEIYLLSGGSRQI